MNSRTDQLPSPGELLREVAPPMDLRALHLVGPGSLDDARGDRLLSGAPLGWEELEAGFAVPRRIHHPATNTDVPLGHLATWLGDRRGTSLSLSAQAGEGKSTFVSQVARAVWPHVPTLHWDLQVSLELDEIRQILAVLAGGASASSWILITAEMPPALNRTGLDNVIASCNAHDAARLRSVLIIGGRSRESAVLERRTQVERVRLQQLSKVDSANLAAAINRAADAAGTTVTDDRYPNLAAFLSMSPDARSALLREPGKPLLASLLQATYGVHLRNRLRAELLDDLESDQDRMAYVTVCLASAAGISLPDEALEAIAPDCDIARRGIGDPWVNTCGQNSARHALIAQAVLELAGFDGGLRSVLAAIADAAGRNAALSSLFLQIIRSAPNWSTESPLVTGSAGQPSRFKDDLLRCLRDVLKRDDLDVVAIAQRSVADDPRILSDWAAGINALIPSRPAPSHMVMCETVLEMLNELESAIPLQSVEEAHRLRYYRFKSQARIRELREEATQVETARAWIDEWASHVFDDWWSPDFFADLFFAACTLIETYEMSSTTSEDEQVVARIEELCCTAMTAAVRFRSEAGPEAAYTTLGPRFGAVIGRLAGLLLGDRYRGLLESGWATSRTYGPDPRLAHLLGNYLEDKSTRAEQVGHWKSVVAALPDEVRGLLRLAYCSNNDIEGRRVVADRAHLLLQRQEWSTPSGRPRMHHALALVTDDNSTRETSLRTAVSLYETAVDDSLDAEATDEVLKDWRRACETLRRVCPGVDCEDALRAAERRVQRARERANRR